DVHRGKRSKRRLPEPTDRVDPWTLVLRVQCCGSCQGAYCPNIFVAQPGAYIGSGNPLGVPNTEMTDPGVLQNTSQRHTCSAKSKDLECRTITLRLELVFVVGSETTKFATFKNRSDTT